MSLIFALVINRKPRNFTQFHLIRFRVTSPLNFVANKKTSSLQRLHFALSVPPLFVNTQSTERGSKLHIGSHSLVKLFETPLPQGDYSIQLSSRFTLCPWWCHSGDRCCHCKPCSPQSGKHGRHAYLALKERFGTSNDELT